MPYVVTLLFIFYFIINLVIPVSAKEINDNYNKLLLNLSPSDLSKQKVIGTYKKEETAYEIPTAISIITHEDIRRLGIVKIAEALKIIPGIHVTLSTHNTWIVSSRGVISPNNNRMLVLVDGRMINDPINHSVNWDAININIEDIERIEVTKGAGGVFISNDDFSGVINIISKHTRYTKGTHMNVAIGTEGKSLSVRYGNKLTNNNTYFRTYAKFANFDSISDNDYSPNILKQAGFRLDWYKRTRTDYVTIEGNVSQYNNVHNHYAQLSKANQGHNLPMHKHVNNNGFIFTSWKHIDENKGETITRLYFTSKDDIYHQFKKHTNMFDLDFSHSFNINEQNDINWGINLNNTWYNLSNYLIKNNLKYSHFTHNIFLQDKITLVKDKLAIILGAKIKSNTLHSPHIQPNIKMILTPNKNHLIWASSAKLIRTSSLIDIENNFAHNIEIDLNKYKRHLEQFKVEKLINYEVGYRLQPKDSLSIELSSFYNDYKNIVNKYYDNDKMRLINHNLKARTYGIDLNTNFSVTKNWDLIFAYGFTKSKLYNNIDEKSLLQKGLIRFPRHQWVIRSQLDLSSNIELDNTIYFVDKLKDMNIPAYIRFDTRLSYKPTYGAEFSIIGQNLFGNNIIIPDFTKDKNRTKLGTSFYIQLKLRF